MAEASSRRSGPKPGAACKPGSVSTPGCPDAGEGHSSRPAIAGRLEHSHPDTAPGRGRAIGRTALDDVPIRACSGRGLPRRRSPGCRAWALTPRFHPYLCSPGGEPSAVSFLRRFPSGHPGSPLATSLPCGARTFLPRICPRAARQRSSIHLRPAQCVAGEGGARGGDSEYQKVILVSIY